MSERQAGRGEICEMETAHRLALELLNRRPADLVVALPLTERSVRWHVGVEPPE